MSDQDCIGFMLSNAGRDRLLTAAEEITLGRQVQSMIAILELPPEERPQDWEKTVAKGQRAKDKMISANMRFVVNIAKKYMNRGLDLADLIQEGNLGLIQGIDKFDPERGYKLSTYIYWWIRLGVTRAVANKGRIIRLPVCITEQLNKMKRAQRQLGQELGRTPTVAEVAHAIDLSEERLREILTASRGCTSLDATVTVSNDGETMLGDLIADDGELLAETVLASFQRKQIEAMLDELKPKERFVIRCRFGFETGEAMTLEAIASHLGITREGVRQIQNKALQKLTPVIEDRGGRELLAG
jgi:RNA polymerase sigma factor (sigma-70 family)